MESTAVPTSTINPDSLLHSFMSQYGAYAFFPLALVVLAVVGVLLVKWLGLNPKEIMADRRATREHEFKIAEVRATEVAHLTELGRILTAAVERAEKHASRVEDMVVRCLGKDAPRN